MARGTGVPEGRLGPRWPVDEPTPVDGGAPRSEAFQADLAALRRPPVDFWPTASLQSRLVHLVLRQPVQTLTPAQVPLAWSTTVGMRLLLPVAVTTLAGAWADAPIWRWLLIAGLLATSDVASFGQMHQPAMIDRFMALAPAIDRDEDLHELVLLTRLWSRFRIMVPAAGLVALAVLSACALVAPGQLRAVHVGSLAMLATLLYEFGEAVVGSVFHFAPFVLKESHVPHRLSWLSPLDSPPVQEMLHAWGYAITILAASTTAYFVFAVVLLEPDSVTVLLAPVAGFAMVALAVTLGGLMGLRSSVRRIVRHTRDETLQRLQGLLDSYQPRLEDLSPAEWQQLEGLIATYAAVRDAPTSPSGEQTLGRAAGALAIPALGFLLAVLAEVYAERLLEQVLP